MPLDTWLAYVVATFILVAIPGPTILLVISYSLARGRTATLPLVVGVTLGDLTAMTFSFLGLGLLLQTASTIFWIFKWGGAAYLFYLGVSLWREPLSQTEPEASLSLRESGQKILYRSWLTTSLNPKGIVFFLAFVPQFINPEVASLPQLLILGSTFLVLAALNVLGYALLASRFSELMHRPRLRQRLNRVGGGLLCGAAVATVST